MTPPHLLQEYPLDYRDPRTYQPRPEREGLPGHPGLSRDEPLFLRLPHHIKQRIVFLSIKQKRSINDVALDYLVLCLEPLPQNIHPIEPSPPELTPEVAHENFETTLKKAFVTGELVAPVSQNKEEEATEQDTPEPPNLWTDLVPALTERVSEQSFDIWLSSVRFLRTDNSLLQLQVPNAYFKEYLTEHYTEVVQEELQTAHSSHFKVEFVVAPPKLEASPSGGKPRHPANPLLDVMVAHNISSLDDLEAFEDALYPELYRRRLDAAAQRCTRYQGDALAGRRFVGFNDARMAEEVAILKNQRLKEEKAREEFRKKRRALFAICNTIDKLRQRGNPRAQRQYADASHFDPEGPVTRGEVSALSQALKGKDYS